MPTFSKKQRIGNYIVTFHVKDSKYAETYRVKDETGKNFFLKLFDYSKLHRTQFDEGGEILELSIVKNVHHPNILTLHDDGELICNGCKKAYAVYDYIVGETLAEKVNRERQCSLYDARQITLGILEGVRYLHTKPQPIMHNELTIQNIMLDLSKSIPTPKIIDFGYARYLQQSQRDFLTEGLNPFYMAPETFNGVFTAQSDLYSVGVLLYHILFGLPPHFIDLSPFQQDRNNLIDAILNERRKPLKVPEFSDTNLWSPIVEVINKALAENIDDRFKNAEEFIKALTGEIKICRNSSHSSPTQSRQLSKSSTRSGNGFADVAGMEMLKEQLRSDVIDLLKNPEQAKELGLALPNGLLFYGPPGCGKTYFAEKFAEEVGCNYMYIRCSDIASPYIHGGQDKIAAVFAEARKNAPTILFFDEIDAMLQSRSKQDNASMSGEVNEFLTQLNNCGIDGVIVIGATNKPNEIDDAALRAGRLEFKYYIPLPDFETRKALFRIHLKRRKVDLGIDYDKLAKLTDNYISADIELIVDTAARFVFRNKLNRISLEVLENAIKITKPSVSLETIKSYEAIKAKFEDSNSEPTARRKIGF